MRRKLMLNREILRELDARELDPVRGGFGPTDGCTTLCSQGCPPPSQGCQTTGCPLWSFQC
jgi:hypothetical protein